MCRTSRIDGACVAVAATVLGAVSSVSRHVQAIAIARSHPRSRAVPKPFLHKAPLVVQGVSSTKPSNDNPDTFQVKPRASNSWHLLMVCMRGDRDLSMTMRCLSNG